VSSSNGRDAFRANFGGPITILNPLTNKHHDNIARGINSKRQCAGEVYDSRKGQRAVLWQPDGSAVDLNAGRGAPWTRINSAWDINDGGAIIGIGTLDDNMPHGWIMLPQ